MDYVVWSMDEYTGGGVEHESVGSSECLFLPIFV